jgi:two-component system nitrate/nitrite response regulator NarL
VPAEDEIRKLTPKQREVAYFVSRGCSNGQIGSLLGMSENTVKKHLKDIFTLLDLCSRIELALLAKDLEPGGAVPFGISHVRDVAIARRRA